MRGQGAVDIGAVLLIDIVADIAADDAVLD
jgi:hypothetical protein